MHGLDLMFPRRVMLRHILTVKWNTNVSFTCWNLYKDPCLHETAELNEPTFKDKLLLESDTVVVVHLSLHETLQTELHHHVWLNTFLWSSM